MVYRFRAGHEDKAFTTAVDYKGSAHVVSRATPLSDIYGLNPLNEDFQAADFDGSGDYVTTRSAVKVKRESAEQGLTVQVWFKADTVSGSQVLLSNRNLGGFAVSLKDDQLVGSVRVGDSYAYVRTIERVKAGTWYMATFRAYTEDAKSDPYAILTMHIDHSLSGMEHVQLKPGETIVDSAIPLTLGAEAGQLDYPFNGRIHAATVRNYAMALPYLSIATVQDGGELMGVPSFDDGKPYGGSGKDAWRPADQSVDYNVFREHKAEPPDAKENDDDNGPVEARTRAFVPFVSDDYVVQGVAHSCEADQSCSQNLLYLSHYWMTPGFDGESGRVDVGCTADGSSDYGSCTRERLRNRSIVSEIDLDSMRVTRCFRLAGSTNDQRFGHVGGIAYYDGNVYVASDGYVIRYHVGRAPSAPMAPDAPCEELYRDKFPSGNIREYNTTSASYISLAYDRYKRPVMMVGSSGASGDVRVYKHSVTDFGNLESAWESYWVPYSTQGVELVVENSIEYLVVSASEGLYKYRADFALQGIRPHFSNIKYYPFLPRLAEDTARVKDTYWSASESGARYYQRRPFTAEASPTGYFFPFIYTFQPASMTWRNPGENDFKQ